MSAARAGRAGARSAPAALLHHGRASPLERALAAGAAGPVGRLRAAVLLFIVAAGLATVSLTLVSSRQSAHHAQEERVVRFTQQLPVETNGAAATGGSRGGSSVGDLASGAGAGGQAAAGLPLTASAGAAAAGTEQGGGSDGGAGGGFSGWKRGTPGPAAGRRLPPAEQQLQARQRQRSGGRDAGLPLAGAPAAALAAGGALGAAFGAPFGRGSAGGRQARESVQVSPRLFAPPPPPAAGLAPVALADGGAGSGSSGGGGGGGGGGAPAVAPAPASRQGGVAVQGAVAPPGAGGAATVGPLTPAPALPPLLLSTEPKELEFPLWWHGPIWSGSGYGSEAINFALSLLRSGLVRRDDVWVSNHGDHARRNVVESMNPDDRAALEHASALPQQQAQDRAAIVVCHSMPSNYAVPDPLYSAGERCPPDPKRFGWSYSIARTMFETDKIPAFFVPRCNAMHEVWVPSEWQRDTFVASGVEADKIRVVPEGVNTTLFDPANFEPLRDLPQRAQLVFGRPWADKAVAAEWRVSDPSAGHGLLLPGTLSGGAGGSGGEGPGAAGGRIKPFARRRRALREAAEQQRQLQQAQRQLQQAQRQQQQQEQQQQAQQQQQPQRLQQQAAPAPAGAAAGAAASRQVKEGGRLEPFKFISSFKWEPRKGWDILLEAYLSEFTAEDDVELYILTKPFGDSGDGFSDKMAGWAAQKFGVAVPGMEPPPPPPAAAAAAAPNGTAGGGADGGADAAEAGGEEGGNWGAAFADEAEGADEEAAPARRLAAAPPATGAAAGPLPGGEDERARRHAAAVSDEMLAFWAGREAAASAPAAAALVAAGAAPAAPGAAARRRRSTLGTHAGAPSRAAATAIRAAAAAAQGINPQTGASTDVIQEAEGVRIIKGRRLDTRNYPTLYVVNSHMSDDDYPRFYATGDAFVIPSRGEGWGRPHVEAMSMALPVIATNWSGVTAFLDESVGYPLPIDGLVPAAGEPWMRGLKWAQPSVAHLRRLMRRVFTDRQEAAARGAAARARMVERYSPDAIAEVLMAEIRRISEDVPPVKDSEVEKVNGDSDPELHALQEEMVRQQAALEREKALADAEAAAADAAFRAAAAEVGGAAGAGE